jgi:hypothetical protein
VGAKGDKKMTPFMRGLLGLTFVLITLQAGGRTAFAQASSLQDVAKLMESLPQIVIYTAKEVVTLDPAASPERLKAGLEFVES